jgi:hypothetical protein
MRIATLILGVVVAAVAAPGLAGEKVRIVNEGGIKDQWTLAEGTKLAAPGYPAALVERGDSVCLALGYAIKPDGTTSDFSIVKSWSSAGEQSDEYWDAFAQASAGAVSQWAFAPRPEVAEPQPTYTVATMQFMGKPAMDGAELRGHCRVDDLVAQLKRNKRNNPMNSQVRRDIEQAERNRSAQGNVPPVRPRPANGG